MARYTVTLEDDREITIDAERVIGDHSDFEFVNGHNTISSDAAVQTVAIFPRRTVRSIIKEDTSKPTVGKAYIDIVSVLDEAELEAACRRITDRVNAITDRMRSTP